MAVTPQPVALQGTPNAGGREGRFRPKGNPDTLLEMRKQYHIRDSERGLLAWDVDRLLRLTSGQEPVDLPLAGIRELDETFWFSGDGDEPTCRRVAQHAKLIIEASLDHPIIIDPEGRVMGGMHRVCKALITGLTTIKAVELSAMPEPDFVGVPIDQLPYERDDR